MCERTTQFKSDFFDFQLELKIGLRIGNLRRRLPEPFRLATKSRKLSAICRPRLTKKWWANSARLSVSGVCGTGLRMTYLRQRCSTAAGQVERQELS